MNKALEFLGQGITVPNEDIGIPQVSANDATLGLILSGVFMALGGAAVAFLLMGSIRYIISNGDQSQVQKAKNTILYAVVGIVVSLLAFTIVQFVLGSIFE